MSQGKGPLDGVRVLEIAGLAPAPFCGMILADFGADVIRIDRLPLGSGNSLPRDFLTRGKRSIGLNLKAKEGVELFLKMAEKVTSSRLTKKADIVIEPFRAGVAERLGIGPSIVLERNPRLIYARLTGWGQNGLSLTISD